MDHSPEYPHGLCVYSFLLRMTEPGLCYQRGHLLGGDRRHALSEDAIE
jgi:hypothetical protein